MHEVEHELHGFTHAEAGAYLLGLWGLPYPIVEAVAHHHAPWRVKQCGFDTLASIHVADHLAWELLPQGATQLGAGTAPLNLGYLQSLGVANELETWRALAARQVELLGSNRGGRARTTATH